MGQIEIEVTADVLKMVKQLAADHYGDSDEAAMGQVVQAALEMRLKWFDVAGTAALEVEEPIASWETRDESGEIDEPEMLEWMFRREG